MKRLFTFVCIFITTVTLWANGICINGINYILDGNSAKVTYKGNTYSIGGENYTGSIIIPDSVTYNNNTYIVNSIGEYAFCYANTMTSISIPKTINSIEMCAFWECKGLTAVYISDLSAWCNISFLDNPLRYAKHLYLNSNEIRNLILPSSVSKINAEAFAHCQSIESVILNTGLKEVSNSIFMDCSNLKKVFISKTVQTMSYYAFGGCTGLEFLVCFAIDPPTIWQNHDDTFTGCDMSIPLYVPAASLNKYKEQWYTFTNIRAIEDTTFCSQPKYSVENKTVCKSEMPIIWHGKTLQDEGVYFDTLCNTFGCDSSIIVFDLKVIDVPTIIDSMTMHIGDTIKWHSFVITQPGIFRDTFQSVSGCDSICELILSLDCRENHLCGKCGENAFWDLDTITKSFSILGKGRMYNYDFYYDYIMGYERLNVNSPWYEYRHHIETIQIESGVTKIGNRAFYNCMNLLDINIPEGIDTIGWHAIWYCPRIKTLTIPQSVRFVGSTFNNCDSLTTMIIKGDSMPNFACENDGYCHIIPKINCYVPCNFHYIKDDWGYPSINHCYYHSYVEWNIIEPDAPYKIEILCNDTTMGSIETLVLPTCRSNEVVLVAHPNRGYELAEWSGICKTDTCAFIQYSDTVAHAIFKPVLSGMCGDSVTWSFDTIIKTITLDGSGDTYWYDSIGGYGEKFSPWTHLKDEIESIIVEPKVEYVADLAFWHCKNASAVYDYRQHIGQNLIYAPFVKGMWDWWQPDTTQNYHITCFADGEYLDSIGLMRDLFVPSVIILETDTTIGRVEILEHETECGGSALIAAYPLDSIKYRFSRWSDGNKNAVRELEVLASSWNDTIGMSAYFELNNYLVAFNSTEGGRVDKDSTYVMYLDSITFTAVPHYGYHFVQWSDGVTAATRTEIIRQDTSYYAIFAKNLYHVSVQWNSEYGSVTGDTCGLYEYQTNFKTIITPKYAYWAHDGKSYYPFEFTQYTTIISDTTIIIDFQPMQGKYGKNVTWTLGTDSVLRFTGSGDMYNTKNTNIGWGAITKTIKKGIVSEGITSVGFYAFGGCTTMTSVELPSSVTLIARSAFSCCESLKEIAIPGNVTSIESDAFYDCQSLTSVTIPNEVHSIGSYAFAVCGKLTSIIFGSKLSSIGAYAFKDCYYVDNMTIFAETPPTVESTTFASLSKYAYLNVPSGSLRAYQMALYWRDFLVQAIGAEPIPTVDDVQVDVSSVSVTITWPKNGKAGSYTIEIKKDGRVIFALTFNAQGQLINITFAPGRGMNNNVDAIAVEGGFRFTITSLNPGTTYTYSIDTKDEEGTSIRTDTGAFTTTGETPTGINEVDSQKSKVESQKFLRDGVLLIERNGVYYNAQGTIVE